MLQHNSVASEWHHLCAQALTPAAVTDEHLIHTGRSSNEGSNAVGAEPLPEIRGDVAVFGFWRKSVTTIFDVRVTDTDAISKTKSDPRRILAYHEKEKKTKYLDHCLARRRHFTPLVFSVDGLRGGEADAATKRLAALLANKWKRAYSDVCGFVRSRLAITLVRNASQCLRGARDPSARQRHAVWDTGAGLSAYL